MSSSASSQAKRPAAASSSTPAIKTPCQIHSSAVIADKAQITGSHAVSIGENVVIQPHARIRAEGGRVTIGKNSTIAEKAVIGFAAVNEDGSADDVVLGDYVTIEGGAKIEAASIGDGSTIEANCSVGKGAVVGKDCKVAALNDVRPGAKLDDFTVVFGDGMRRVDQTLRSHAEIQAAKRSGQEKTIAMLQRLIPNSSSKWM